MPRTRWQGAAAAAGLLLAVALLWRGWPERAATATSVDRREARASVATLVLDSRPREGGVGGRVRSESGASVAGAQVCAVCAGCNPSQHAALPCVSSGADGTYALRGLEAIAYRIAASAEGYIPAFYADGALLKVTGAEQSEIDIVLGDSGARIAGHVIDATGGPVVAAELRIVRWHGDAPLAVVAYSDVEGRFSAHVPPGAVSIHARAEGYSSLGMTRIAPAEDVELVMMPGGGLRGRVVMARDGRPVAGAEVSAALMAANRSFERGVSSDDHGQFRIDGLEPGAYRLAAVARGFRGALADPVIVVGVGHTTSDIEIAVEMQAQVEGRVSIGATGEPCVEGRVMLGPPGRVEDIPDVSPAASYRAPTDPERAAKLSLMAALDALGVAHFDAVPAGHYAVSVYCARHVWRAGPSTLEVAGEDVRDLSWRVEPGIGLDVRVVDDRGAPVPHATAWLQLPTRDGSANMTPMPGDAEGRCRYPADLFPGRYVLHADNAHSAEPVELDLKEGMGTVLATLRLRGSSTIEARIQTPDGQPVDGVRLIAQRGGGVSAEEPPLRLPSMALGHGGSTGVTATALGAGRYRLGPIEAGSYRLSIVDDLNPAIDAVPGPSVKLVELEPHEVARVQLVYERSASITGRVIDDSGDPVVDAWVYLDAEEPDASMPSGQRGLRLPASSRLTDPQGEFEFTRLVPRGVFTLRAELPDGSGSATLRGVRPGSPIVLALREPGALHGTVTGGDGKPADSFMIEWKERGGSARKQMFTRAAGKFALDTVAPGELFVRALAADARSERLEIALAPGQRVGGIQLKLEDPAAPPVGTAQ